MPLIRATLIALLALLLGSVIAEASPSVIAPPVVTGTVRVGETLAAVDARVAEAAPEDITLTWERSSDHGFAMIAGAHEATYTPVARDVGHRLRVHLVVETASGTAEAWSAATTAVSYGASQPDDLVRIGAAAGAPARLDRWAVVAGDMVHLRGHLSSSLATGELRLVLEPTIPTYRAVSVPVSIDAAGRIQADATPVVNARAWLEVTPMREATQRVLLGMVGVRPLLRVRLGAESDGRDSAGRALIRDLRLLSGSAIAPGIAGLRMTWEGKLPGERTGTAVCRSTERVTSLRGGRLRGGCNTRGAWASARWRLVLVPDSADPSRSPFLAAASRWITPRLGPPAVVQVPNLPRSSATLRPWI